MTDSQPASAGAPPAAATTTSRRALSLPLPGARVAGDGREREALIARARATDAACQLQRCFPRWLTALDHLAWRALVALAANQPVDPNDPDAWATRDAHAQAVLRRHGHPATDPARLSLTAIRALIDGQARADSEAGLDWAQVTVPARTLDERLRRAHARLPIDLSDPAVHVHRGDQRRALAGQLRLGGEQADDLSRWVLAYPEQFQASDRPTVADGTDGLRGLKVRARARAPAFRGGCVPTSPTMQQSSQARSYATQRQLDEGGLTGSVATQAEPPRLVIASSS